MGARIGLLSTLVVVAVLGLGCSGSDSTTTEPDGTNSDGTELTSTDAVSSGPTTTGPYTSPEQIPGIVTSKYSLLPGQCFDIVDLVAGGSRQEQWAVLPSCDEPHRHEVYLLDTFPAGKDDPWPGDELFDAWGRQQCYAGFADYVGEIYELSPYRIGFVRPTEANFTHPIARYRTLTCYLTAPGSEPVEGSAADSAR